MTSGQWIILKLETLGTQGFGGFGLFGLHQSSDVRVCNLDVHSLVTGIFVPVNLD